ncbi:hypothetical protein HI914_04616 [Erysiphe necator]|nr:hypothetical protein HI914_04616 [Erysiphe necator]
MGRTALKGTNGKICENKWDEAVSWETHTKNRVEVWKGRKEISLDIWAKSDTLRVRPNSLKKNGHRSFKAMVIGYSGTIEIRKKSMKRKKNPKMKKNPKRIHEQKKNSESTPPISNQTSKRAFKTSKTL